MQDKKAGRQRNVGIGTGGARLPPAEGAGAAADNDRRRQRSARLPDHRLAGAQPCRRRASVAETRERVIKAAAKLGYQPVVAAARRLFGGDHDRLCLRRFSTDPWTAIGLDGVREKAWAHGLTVTVMATRGDADMEAAALAQLAELPLAGLIYATINTRLVGAPAWARRRRRPCSNCHGPAPPFPRWRRARSPAATRPPTFSSRRPQADRLHQRRDKHGGRAASLARLSAGARHRGPAVRSRPRSRRQLAAAVGL